MSTTTEASPQAPPPRKGRGGVYKQLWFWVLVGITAGIVVGFAAPGFASDLKVLPDIFIQLIKMVTAPVIFCTVIVGIASIGNLAAAGGIAGRALAYFLLMTVIALGLGLVVVNIVQPGAGFPQIPPDPATLAEAQEDVAAGAQGGGAMDFITGTLLPESFLGPFVENEILRVLVLAILVAAATSMLAPALRKRVVGGVDLIAKILFGIIRMIMFLAPLAAFGGIAYTVGALGGESLTNLLSLMVTFWATCAIFVFGVLFVVCLLSGFNVFKLIRMIKDEILIIVGTSSSETVLPRLLAKLEAAGASRSTVSMVLPTGYSFNLDGTCIYLTMAALFIAQAGGQDLPWGVQLGLVALMLLTSKGAAGVSGAGLITLAASLQAFGGEFYTVESIAIGIAIIAGIDRIMSEGRALTNVIGNTVAVMVVAGWCGERDDEKFQAALNDPSLVRDAIEQETHGGEDDEASASGDRTPVGASA
ncbi:cation:dicarboxylate symporter family transporter [Actinomycetospora termitidis]|uniref:Cation:dicarboxylase symporter family transporter n=1 Tax=Actinomycetospora termitidis TaxID=3053470 RepID=A0ABT7MAS7_9PSEU|nr:cation:dicarboxylase symporter family transporter [Actinomycetospora sp. Odt1-22]MDL5157304.1 cation:dicarboxylase symporter family transporter [Actinomycetospora sp. Odt1-22]